MRRIAPIILAALCFPLVVSAQDRPAPTAAGGGGVQLGLRAPCQDLVTEIAARFDDPAFSAAHWGVLIQSLDTGRVWFERNADRLFLPASNEKIPTAATALVVLGADHTFESVVCRRGEVKDGVLRGDLVVVGDGDPSLHRRFHEDSRAVFRSLAEQLRSAGIRRVTGDLIGDDDAFDDRHLGYGWSIDNLPYSYAAELGALQLAENHVTLSITPPQELTGRPQVASDIPSGYYQLREEIEVVAEGKSRVRISRPLGENIITLRGRVVAGSDRLTVSATVSNPTGFYVAVMRDVLEAEGIVIDGEAIDCDDVPDWAVTRDELPRVASWRSPPLSQLLGVLMKESNNLYAETLVRALGLVEAGLGSFENGAAVVARQLESFGIPPESYAFEDGSGLTRYNWFSPRQLVTILAAMRQQPDEVWTAWRDCLPVAGEDGTLKRRMTDSPAQGNVRAKTGTISNVSALSGYVRTADGEELAFSFIVNGSLRPSREARRVQDDVLLMLAGLDRR